ncbi:hypothetical protein HMPREF1544_05663 [Mucor circinelloides 1006PhL]|uniref:AP-3 complex subunit delta Mu C-terminal domain-containing protein n=1 Tax=Mucor circinelloides f. circinelloides (strain 1006PhL) TaxID=1220926 RepID=S2JGE3_MUCC1|nr:hypothetical protein HMPREF1544_05663 [Mucor circinelloides 1006PhL]
MGQTPAQNDELVPEEMDVNMDDIKEAVNEKPKPSVEIFSNDQVSLMGLLQLDAAKEIPTIGIHFTVENKDQVMLPSLHMEFAQSFDLKSITNEDSNVAAATEHFELQANEKVECEARFQVQGNPRRGLCLRGDLFYDIEGSSVIQQHAIEIPIPVSLFLVDTPMDPTSFATLLAEHGSEFEYHGNVQVQVALQEESSIQEAIINAFEIVTRTSGLMVVEVIAGAASLYGKSIQGSQVAGLLKCNLDMEDKMATLTIDLKSTDDDLLDGMIHQLESIQNSL